MRGTVFPDLLGVRYIQMLVNGIIEFRRIRPCPDVKNKPDSGFLYLQPFEKTFSFHLTRKLLIRQVRRFIGTAEFIYQDEIGISLRIQVTGKAAADKAGGSGHYNIFLA